MSGGSYNYLHSKEDSELFEQSTLVDIDNMGTRLISLGYIDAAKETLALSYIITQAIVRAQVLQERLQYVWRAVEWYDSADVGIQSVERAMSKYRGEGYNEKTDNSKE